MLTTPAGLVARRYLLSVLAVGLAAVAGICVAAFLLARQSGTPVRSSAGVSAATRVVHVGALKGFNPAYAGLSPDQMLDKSATEPYIHGVIRGITGPATVRELPTKPDGVVKNLVTDFSFTVRGFVGPGTSSYPIGSVIILRTPGGTQGNLTVTYEDGPSVTTDQDVYIILRDQGQSLGGSTSTVLVASDEDDVFTVQNGTVHGQGGFGQLVEPAATFEVHFLPRGTPTSR